MTQYNTLNLKLPTSQLKKVKIRNKKWHLSNSIFDQIQLVNLIMRLTFRTNYY